MGKITFRLTQLEVAELRKPVNGQGGYQTLFRELQPLITRVGSLTVTDQQLGRIVRSCKYGAGGFQARLRAAFGRSIRDLLEW
ncbi:MAG: hypothetical protein C0472_11405 [Erythrobacter sp.]|nr:hypothetical protein [Erythrobacter sp.]